MISMACHSVRPDGWGTILDAFNLSRRFRSVNEARPFGAKLLHGLFL
jgi:hypothetical protein